MTHNALRLLAGVLLVAILARGEAASSYSFLGCFKDSTHGRVLSNKQNFDDLSPGVCAQHCLGLQLPLFGLQNGEECWCGSDDIRFEDYAAGPEFCDLECSGDSDVVCGEHSAFSLYKIGALPAAHKPDNLEAFTLHNPKLSELASTAEYLGCFADDINDRVLSTVVAASDVTPEACVQYCARLSMPFSATQSGNECWCAGSVLGLVWVPVYDRHGSGDCNYACSGDASLRCGGALSFSLYKTDDLGTGPCNPNPCLNGGSCSVDPAGGHICTCATGYGGMSYQTDTSGLAEFYIEFFNPSGFYPSGDLGYARLSRLFSAAGRWEDIITHTPCGGNEELPAGRVHITLTTLPSTLSYIGGFPYIQEERREYWVACEITATGSLNFDTPGITFLDEDQFEEIVFHKIGHILGIGLGWDLCTAACTRSGVSEYGCLAAEAAYNDLAGNEQGTPAFIVDTADGFLACEHVDPDVLGEEISTGISDNLDRWPVSKITVAALENLGYIVDPSKAEAYLLPT